jgi:hypothetical protein
MRQGECWIDCLCGEHVEGDLDPFGLPTISGSSGQLSSAQQGNVNCRLEAAWARHVRPNNRNHWPRLSGLITTPRRTSHHKLVPLIVRQKGFEQRLYPLPGHPGWYRVDYFVRNV